MLWRPVLSFALAMSSPPSGAPPPNRDPASRDDGDDAEDEIDAFWAKARTAVVHGDFDAYAAMYHPDAVVVDTTAVAATGSGGGCGSSKPARDALAEWKSGFEATASGLKTTQLDFRFSRRVRGVEPSTTATTAYDAGIFRYRSETTAERDDNDKNPTTSTPATTAAVTSYIHFEALMIKKEGVWLWIMEYQKQKVTEEEWNEMDSESMAFS